MDESEHDISHEIKLAKDDGYETETSSRSKKLAIEKEDEKEDITVACPHHVGYLKKRSKDEGVPDSCLTCPKILQCMV
jgi:hypothetical protein